MKKLSTIILLLIVCYGAKAQVTSGEKFLGGGLSISSSNGTTAVTILPEFRYAHADNRLLGGRAGVSSSGSVTLIHLGPNYTWLFPIEGNFFWSLTGFVDFTFGDINDVRLGGFPGLGYRIHDKWMINLTNSGISYSTNAELFSLNASLSGFSVGAFYRIGK